MFLFTFLQDKRFNHDIDVLTGYRTQTLLCMPIKDTSGDVIGVAQVREDFHEIYVFTDSIHIRSFWVCLPMLAAERV